MYVWFFIMATPVPCCFAFSVIVQNMIKGEDSLTHTFGLKFAQNANKSYESWNVIFWQVYISNYIQTVFCLIIQKERKRNGSETMSERKWNGNVTQMQRMNENSRNDENAKFKHYKRKR